MSRLEILVAAPGPPPDPPYLMFLILVIPILLFPLIIALVLRMMRSGDKKNSEDR